VRSIKRVFQSGVLEVQDGIGGPVDSTVQEYIETMKATNTAYRDANSFFYPRGGFYGFNFGANTLVYAVTEKAKGWVFFNGAFADSDAIHALPDGRLLVSANDQLLYYADGQQSTTKVYTDNGDPLKTIWFTGWREERTRWDNKFFQFLIEPTTKEQTLVIRRFRDSNSALDNPESGVIGGDLALWDEALWDVAMWDSPSTRPTIRDKFIAENFAMSIETNNTDGAFEIAGVIAYAGG
jgi:hypothetical protein